MGKLPAIVALTLAIAACAHHRQPKVRCTGHLERINVSEPASRTDPVAQQDDAPKAQPKPEGDEP